MVHRTLTNLEAVALAVRSEMESIDLYGALAGTVRNPAARKILEDLAADEERHRASLVALYRQMLQGQEASVPESDGRAKTVAVSPDADPLAVLEAARNKEIESEAFYRKAAESVFDFKTRMFFLDVAASERQHAATLGKMVEQLKKDPRWLEREAADPFKALHLGP